MRTFKFKAVSVVISMALALALPFGVMAADGFGDGSAFDAAWDDANDFDNEWDDPDAFDFNEDETIESQVGDAFDFNEDQTIESQVGDDFGFFSVDAFVAAEGEAPESSSETPSGTEDNKKEYFFHYHEEGFADFSVTDHQGNLIGTAEVFKEFPADCENNAGFILAIDIKQDTILSDRIEYDVSDPKYKRATGHTWKEIIAQDVNGDVCDDDSCPCETGVEIDYVYQCINKRSDGTDCGKYLKKDSTTNEGVESTDPVEDSKNGIIESKQGVRIYDDHKWSDPVTVYLTLVGEDDNTAQFVEIDASKAKEDDWVVTYRLCQNKGCAHVKYSIKRNSSLEFEGFDYVGDTNGDGKDDGNVDTIPADYLDPEKTPYPLTPAQFNDIVLINCAKDGKIIAKYVNYEKVDLTAIDTNGDLDTIDEDELYTLFKKPQGDPSNISVKVPAHHTYMYKYVMKNTDLAKADVGAYVNILDADGNIAEPVNGLYKLDTTIGTSKYCVDFEIEKIKTTVCNKANHAEKKDITTSEGVVIAKATPGSHFYKTELKYKPDSVKINELKDLKDKTIKFADYKKLKKNSNLDLTTDVTDCTKGGNGTAAFKCEFCKQAIASTKVNFKIDKEPKHSFTQLEMTEVVEPTCITEGSYIPVMTCENCGVKSTGTKQIVPKTKHVYDNVSPAAIKVDGQIVVGDIWGAESDYAVGKTINLSDQGEWYYVDGKDVWVPDPSGVLVIGDYADSTSQSAPAVKVSLTRKCTVCGEDITILTDDLKSLKATVTAVTKEGADGVYCKEGLITVKIDGTPADGVNSLEAVSEEVTLRYYSSLSEYVARYSAHTPGQVVKSNEVEPTETEAGGYDETISCIFCEKVISQRHVTIPALGHTHDMVAVEAKEATCTEAGNIAYYECQKCGLKYKTAEGVLEDQLTDEEVVIPAIGHEIELVEAKEPTCVDGHAAYYVCHNCGEIFKDAEGKEPISYDEVKIEATEEHTPAEPVVEQREDGVYSVVYCDRCGIEISAEPYKGEAVELLEGPKTFNLKANKPNAGYMEFKLGEVEGAEKYRVSYRIAGTKPYTRQESDNHVVKITDLERGQVYDFTACAGDVLEDDQIQWGARALRKDGAVKYARRWYETVEQSKIAKKGTVITLEWTFLNDASKYEISIADNKAMDNAVTVDAAMFSPQIVGDKVQVSADITALPGFDSVPAGSQIKFYVRIRPYTMYDEKDVAGGVSNLRAKTIKF